MLAVSGVSIMLAVSLVSEVSVLCWLCRWYQWCLYYVDCVCVQVELQQLEIRFPGNQSCLVEKGALRAVYRVTITPTDPEWVRRGGRGEGGGGGEEKEE